MGYGSKEVKGGSWMSKHSLANSRFIKDMPIEHDMHRDGPKKYGAMKGDQSATRTDYKNYKGTDKGYKGKDGESHGDQSATKKDYGG